MTRAAFSGIAQDRAGNGLNGAQITFRAGTDADSPLASVYAAATGGSPLTQPIATDADGRLRVFVAPGGNYRIEGLSEGGTGVDIWAAPAVVGRQYATLSEFESDVDGGYSPDVGTVSTAAGASFRYTGASNEIDSLPGWVHNYAITLPMTLRVPSDFPTGNAALEYIGRRPITGNGFVTITFASGYNDHSDTVVFDHPNADRILVRSANGIVSPAFVGVASVTGSSGAWDVTYQVTGGSLVTTEMLARVAVPKGHRAWPIAGRVTTNGTTSIVGDDTQFQAGNTGFVDQTLGIDADRLLVGNETLTVASVASQTSLTVSTSATTSIVVALGIAHTADAVGSGTIAVTGTSVDGTDTAFLSQLTPGTLIYWTSAAGGAYCGEIASIASDTSATLVSAPNIAADAGTIFVMASNIWSHAGGHEIVAATDTTLTVRNTSRTRPALFGVSSLVIRIPRATIRMTSNLSGVEFIGGMPAPFIQEISIYGTGGGGTQSTHGISVGRRQSSQPILQAASQVLLGNHVVVNNFAGSGAYVSGNSMARLDFIAVSNCLNGVAGTEWGGITARSASLVGNNTNVTTVLGSYINAEEAIIAGGVRGVNQGSGNLHLGYTSVMFNSAVGVTVNGGTLDAMNNVMVQGNGDVGHLLTAGIVNSLQTVLTGNRSHGRRILGVATLNAINDCSNCNAGDGLNNDGGTVRDTASYSCGNGGGGKVVNNRGAVIGSQGRTLFNNIGLSVDNGGYVRQWLGQTASNVTAQTRTDGTNGVANTLSAKGSYLGTS